jgi:hypothetical protein
MKNELCLSYENNDNRWVLWSEGSKYKTFKLPKTEESGDYLVEMINKEFKDPKIIHQWIIDLSFL